MSRALRRLRLTLALAATLAVALPAQAGRACEEQPLTVDALAGGLGLAQATARRLDASGAEVVVLARAGQDLAKYGLQWSHLGLAYRQPAEAGRPAAWRVLHKLNHCGSDRAQLYRQGLGDFFLDHPHRLEAGFVVLAPTVQARLAPLLRDKLDSTRWHEPRYNMVAYPWSTQYQQSNQWAIETLAGAMDPLAGPAGLGAGAGVGADASLAARRERAQAWLRLADYRPTPLKLGAFERLGARVAMAHVAFDDHPGAQRWADRIDTVTVDSVFDWLARSGLGQPLQRVACDAICRAGG